MFKTRLINHAYHHICQAPGALSLLLALILVMADAGSAKERMHRLIGRSSGLPLLYLSGYAQDANGFFWMSTAAGVFRYDGTEFRLWAKDKLTGWHYMVYPAPDGEVFVYDVTHTLYRLLANEDAEPVSGPEGNAFTEVTDVAFTKDKRFWVARQNALFYRNEQNQWLAMPQEIPGNEKIWKLSASLDGSLLVATTQSIWKINPDLSFSRILARSFNGYIGSAIARPDGSLFFMEKHPDGGKIFEWRDGQVTERIALKTNWQGFVLRGQTVWANSDGYVVAFRDGEEPEVLRVPDDIPGAGMMMVDNEGSLWVGATPEGLVQIPEPETVIFNERDGVPNNSTRYFVKTAEGIWVVTWHWGIGRFEQQSKKWQSNEDPSKLGWLAVDGNGRLWGHADDGFFYRYANGKFIKLLPPARCAIDGWSQAPDGTLWLTSDRGLWRTPPEDGSPRFLGNPLGDGLGVDNLLEDRKGRLWLTSGERIGYVAASAVAAGQKVACDWQTLSGTRRLGKIIELPNGSLWVATEDKGVWRYTDDGGWQPIPASLKLASRNVGGFALSPSGGVWVLGFSARFRVIDRPDLADGWQVVEELSDWQGVPSGIITDLIEEPDSSLWIASSFGVLHMPAQVRRARSEPPRVESAGLTMNGERVDLHALAQVPPGHNQLEIQFAALSYRDRGLLRYQYRLHPNDEWTDSASNVPVFRFFDLRPGNYSAEVRASLDGMNWSSTPAHINFEVLPHWYLRPWAIAIFVSLIVLSLLITYRLRVAMLLGLEKQRTRIAMDLHDEVGSGLGSIGILSSIAASSSLNELQRLQLSQQVAETASELGNSLTDIVWSLKTDEGTLEDLAYRLTKRANHLFSNHRPVFKTDFPEAFPPVNLSLATRRNLFLIALEALHNAAKHADAEQVTLSLKPSGQRWLLGVEDDGCGLHNSQANGNGTGLGLTNMQKRAAEIGAEINWSSNNGRGTLVSLKFNPQAKERR